MTTPDINLLSCGTYRPNVWRGRSKDLHHAEDLINVIFAWKERRVICNQEITVARHEICSRHGCVDTSSTSGVCAQALFKRSGMAAGAHWPLIFGEIGLATYHARSSTDICTLTYKLSKNRANCPQIHAFVV
jgi:hypothetical protein